MHLEGCRAFNLGRGQVRPRDELLERLSFEELGAAAAADPRTWGVFDLDGAWWCPSCLTRQTAVRSRGGIDGLVLQSMWRHLRTCPPYLQGLVQPAAEVKRTCDEAQRGAHLARWVAQQLLFEAWRYARPDGAWLCPCCLQGVPEVRLGMAENWSQAPAAIAGHLLRCPAFSPDAPSTAKEEDLRAAAGGAQPVLYPGNTPTQVASGSTSRLAMPVGSTPPGGSAQLAQSGMAVTRTPIAQPRVVPRSRSGRTPLELPAEATPEPPPARNPMPVVGRRFFPTPIPFADHGDAPRAPIPDLAWMDGLDRSAPGTARIAPARQPAAEPGEVTRARQLQESILGSLPDIPGYRFAAHYEACSGLSGDFYTCIALPDGDIGLALGDVSGHGVEAGLVMSMAKKSLEIFARQAAGLAPADTLAKVNDSLTDDLGGKLFVSLVYGVLSPQRRTITWARAGHPPVLRCTMADRTVSEIKPRGMVLGMKAGTVFRQSLDDEVTRIAPGDLFLLYTDGITETANLQGEEFGAERLAEVVRQNVDRDPDTLVAQLVERLRHFRGPRPPADDATLLAFQIAP